MLVQKILTRIEEERGHLLHWAPLFLGTGIGIYFSLRFEPTAVFYAGLVAVIILCGFVAWRWPWGIGPVAVAIGLVAFGLALAGARAHWVAEPVLEFRYYGPVEGRIIKIDRSQSDAVRLTLDQARLDDVRAASHPTIVRVSLHGDQEYLSPKIGQHVAMTAHLSGPNGPVEPGGFRFPTHGMVSRDWCRGLYKNASFASVPVDGRVATCRIASQTEYICLGAKRFAGRNRRFRGCDHHG